MAQLKVCWTLPLGLLLISATSLGLIACRMPTGGTEDANSSVRIALEDVSRTLEGVSDIRRNSRTDTVTRVTGENLSSAIEEELDYQSLQTVDAYDDMASAFLNKHREEFRLLNPASELSVTRVQSDNLGFHQVRFSQRYQDVVVLDAELIVHFNPEDHIYMVNGQYIPTPEQFSLDPRLSAEELADLIKQELGQDLTVEGGSLSIFPSGDGQARLAFAFFVRRSLVESWRVVADANSGEILLRTPTALSGSGEVR